jgi:hypothetical protein
MYGFYSTYYIINDILNFCFIKVVSNGTFTIIRIPLYFLIGNDTTKLLTHETNKIVNKGTKYNNKIIALSLTSVIFLTIFIIKKIKHIKYYKNTELKNNIDNIEKIELKNNIQYDNIFIDDEEFINISYSH